MGKKKISPSMRVCSRHLTQDYYIPSVSKQHYSRKTAVSSMNPPRCSVDNSQKHNHVLSAQREQRRIKRSFSKNEKIRINEQKTTMEPNYFNTDDNSQEERVLDDQIYQRHEDESQNKNCELEEDSNLQNDQVSGNEVELCAKTMTESIIKQFKDVVTQVQTGRFILKFTNFITSDSELNIIIMTFMKLKQNMSYALLAILFRSYTPETCGEKFFQMIDLLYTRLKPGIYRLEKENILKNIPFDFIGFENVCAVIDCTKISIQRPKPLCCQVVTYSRYKSCYTVKFMTPVTPSGLNPSISKPFGGRASDNAIFEQSEIIEKFDKNDDVMTGRGLTVDDYYQKNDVKLISPALLKNRKQFPKVEAINGRRIAKARVHVERCDQRIKSFGISLSKMPIGLLYKVEKIFTIICAIANLSQPILRDEKFMENHKNVTEDLHNVISDLNNF
ncbi:uncharacterized protein LOC125500032 [Athalia rosae]|uniref:uncharacterized protein LOC125500032 n=1 Tax=Athalia rosae TaxID=37344 RepID=UPI0020343F45|nr:uncharacterized protein LOC125500032 [Athalia rosae]